MPGGFSIKHLDLQGLAQPAIAPLGPVLTLFDALTAVIGAVQAVGSLDPVQIAEALEKLVPISLNLASLNPLDAVPRLLATCLDLVIRALEDMRGEVAGLRDQMTALLAVAETARRLKDNRLQGIFDCAKRNVEQEAVNLGKYMASVGSLITMTTTLASLAHLPLEVPDLTRLSEINLDDALRPLDDAIAGFKALRNAVPA